MLGITTVPESEAQVKAFEELLFTNFPDRNPKEMYKVLQLYDDAYIVAREYFAFYYAMGTNTIIEYINVCENGYLWEFLKNAVFDMGINALFRFYDKPSGKSNSKNEHILHECNKVFGVNISAQECGSIAEIRKYRHNNSAHCGNGFHLDSTSIKYDSPLLALEQLRRDREKFNKEKINYTNSIYIETLCESFCSKIPSVIRLLNNNIANPSQSVNELKTYIDEVLNE